MNDVIGAILSRRSVRAFAPRAIPREELEAIAEAAYHAPSGRNRQAWHFTVVQNKAALSSLASAVAAAVGAPSGYDFYSPDALLIASADRANPLAVPDCACALENVFLAAGSLGISSVWINQLNDACADPACRALLTSLGVPAEYDVHGCAALGYAAAPSSPREKRSDVVNLVL